jgi:hypothetical protein
MRAPAFRQPTQDRQNSAGIFSAARIESAPLSRSIEQQHQGLSSPYTASRPSGGVCNHAVDGRGSLDRMSVRWPPLNGAPVNVPRRRRPDMRSRHAALPSAAISMYGGAVARPAAHGDSSRYPANCRTQCARPSAFSLFLLDFLPWRIDVQPMASLLCALHHGKRQQIRPKTGRMKPF